MVQHVCTYAWHRPFSPQSNQAREIDSKLPIAQGLEITLFGWIGRIIVMRTNKYLESKRTYEYLGMVPNSDLRLCLCAVSMLVTEPADVFTPFLFLQCGIIPTGNTNRKVVSKRRFQHRSGTCAMTRHGSLP